MSDKRFVMTDVLMEKFVTGLNHGKSSYMDFLTYTHTYR